MFCKLVLPSNDIHKLPSVPQSYNELHQIALRKIKAGTSDKFFFKYKDSDDDLITLSSDEDLKTAISTSEADNVKTLRIFLVQEATTPNIKHSLPPSEGSLPQMSLVGRSSSFNQNPIDLDNQDEMNLFRRSQTRVGVPDDSVMDPRQMQFAHSEYMEGDRDAGDAMRMSSSGPFNPDQLNAIGQLLERKLSEKIETRVQTIVNELMRKVNEDVKAKSFTNFGPGSGLSQSQVTGQARYNPYAHMPFMSKSVVPAFVRNSQGRQTTYKKSGHEGNCSNCGNKLENIKYTCSECKDVEFCETCEESLDHPHPLLKTRASRNRNDNDSMDISNNVSPNVSSIQRSSTRNSISQLNAGKSQSISNIKVLDRESKGNSISPDTRQQQKIRFMNTMNVLPSDIKRPSITDVSMKNESEIDLGNDQERPSMPGDRRRSIGKSMTTPGPFGTPGEKEVKRYKGTVVKQTIYDLINVKPGCDYQVEFTIKNAGTENWPEDIQMVCINGVHKGHIQSLPALEAGKKSELKLVLKAPQTPGRYLSQWRLQYTEGGTPKPFGGNSFIEINVAEGTGRTEKPSIGKSSETTKENIKENLRDSTTTNQDTLKDSMVDISKEIQHREEFGVQELRERVKPNEVVVRDEERVILETAKPQHVLETKKGSDKNGLSEEDNALLREMKISLDVLKHAKQLHEMYPDEDIKEQINFVEESPLHFDINDIVMLYCARVDAKAQNQNKGKKSLQQRMDEFEF